MAGIRPTNQRDFSRGDVRAALESLVKKGLAVTRTDANGKVVYFCTELAPPPGSFKLKSYRRKVDQDGRREG
jgi:hypothetical protein